MHLEWNKPAATKKIPSDGAEVVITVENALRWYFILHFSQCRLSSAKFPVLFRAFLQNKRQYVNRHSVGERFCLFLGVVFTTEGNFGANAKEQCLKTIWYICF